MSSTPRERRPIPKGFARHPRASTLKALQRLPDQASADRGEERRLLASARSGDRRALRALLDRLAGPVYRFGRGFCGDSPDAEDVAQVVLSALARKLKDFRGESSLSTWAYIVARNACIRQRRAAVRDRGRIESLDGGGRAAALAIADPAADPTRHAERRELRRLLQQAIAALPPIQRETLVLRDVEGLSAPEVARILGIQERAVKSRLHRARLAVREAIAPYVRETGEAQAPSRPVPAMTAGRCPDTARLISRYLEGDLSSEVCGRLERHVAECGACGEACDSLRVVLGACRDLGRDRIPADVSATVRRRLQEWITQPPR